MYTSRSHFLTSLRKCSLCWAFPTTADVLVDHVRLFVTYSPRNLKEENYSTQSPSICSGAGSALFLLQSITISFVLLAFNRRLFALHQAVSLWTTSLYAVSSTPEMRPTTVVSSTNLTMMLEWRRGTQSYVYRAYRKRA